MWVLLKIKDRFSQILFLVFIDCQRFLQPLFKNLSERLKMKHIEGANLFFFVLIPIINFFEVNDRGGFTERAEVRFLSILRKTQLFS